MDSVFSPFLNLLSLLWILVFLAYDLVQVTGLGFSIMKIENYHILNPLLLPVDCKVPEARSLSCSPADSQEWQWWADVTSIPGKADRQKPECYAGNNWCFIWGCAKERIYFSGEKIMFEVVSLRQIGLRQMG